MKMNNEEIKEVVYYLSITMYMYLDGEKNCLKFFHSYARIYSTYWKENEIGDWEMGEQWWTQI